MLTLCAFKMIEKERNAENILGMFLKLILWIGDKKQLFFINLKSVENYLKF